LWPGGPRGSAFVVAKPYFEIQRSLRSSIEARNAFTSNQEEIANIQGTWERSRRLGPGDGPSRVTYIFSEHEFRLTARGASSTSGTFKINNDILMMITNNDIIGLFVVEYKPDNVVFLHNIYLHDNFWSGGEFSKQ